MTTAGKLRLSASGHDGDQHNPMVRMHRETLYMRAFRLSGTEFGPGVDGTAPSETARRLWCRLTDMLIALGDPYDPFLADACWRWTLACCTTSASRASYVKALLHWAAWRAPRYGQRLTLAAQCATEAPLVADYLRHLGDGRGLAVRTVVNRRNILQSWFAWLVELALIERAPINREALRSWRIRHEKVERGDGTRQALTLEEGQRLANWALTVARPIEGLAALLQTVSGLRSHEVAAAECRHLTVSHEEFESTRLGRLVVQGKGNRQRVVVLEPVVIAAWWRYVRASKRSVERGPLLTIGRHAPSARTVQTWAKHGLRAAGRPELSSHDLRRTATTLLIDAGATLEQAQRLLGHASMEMTQRCYVARPKPLSVTTGITVPLPQGEGPAS